MPRDPFFAALAADDAVPIDPVAVDLWLRDLQRPLRWWVLPTLAWLLGLSLQVTWFLKRLSPIDLRAHRPLQWLICWFCEHLVTPEANVLLLRHYATESNLLNFLVDNTPGVEVEPVALYPRSLWDMMQATFVDHDQELFRTIAGLGRFDPRGLPLETLRWDHWRPIDLDPRAGEARWTRFLDFETAHVLFMGLFCLLLTKREYQAAINGFAFDQSIATRVAKMIGDPTVVDMVYNKYPLYLVGPWNLTQRFLMHGFFTEYLYARLERLRVAGAAS
jgi:hypothetical protein